MAPDYERWLGGESSRSVIAQSVVRSTVRSGGQIRRNSSYWILLGEPAHSAFVKDYTRGATPYSLPHHELRVHQYLQTLAGDDPRSMLPTWVSVSGCRLRLELLTGATAIDDLISRHTGSAFEMLHRLGRFLAWLHAVPCPPHETGVGRKLLPPWPTSIHKTTAAEFCQVSDGYARLLRIIQSLSVLCQQLGELERAWETRVVIHNDMRLDNLLVVLSEDERAIAELRVIDWEMSGLGDPAWDVGAVLGDLLTRWLRPMAPFTVLGDAIVGEITTPSRSTIHEAASIFWLAYVAGQDGGASLPPDFANRCVRYAGARLIEAAFEATMMSTSPPLYALLLLDVGGAILDNPEQAGHELFGFGDVGDRYEEHA